jgi:hypothetical protein
MVRESCQDRIDVSSIASSAAAVVRGGPYQADYRVSEPPVVTVARPASSRATGIRNGEQET